MRAIWRRWFAMLVVAGSGFAMAGVAFEAEAKRFGGGFSSGRQSTNVMQQRQATTPPAAASATAGAAGAAGAKAAGSRWLGPLAGIAAGLGIAALLSHFGLSGALADLLVIALIAGIAIFGLSFLMRALRGGMNPATQSAGGQSMARRQFEETAQQRAPLSGLLGAGAPSMPNQQPVVGDYFIPADFDQQTFLDEAKKQFVAVQKAWDTADFDGLRDRLTDEFYAEYAPKMAEHGGNNQTDVVLLNANLMGIEKLSGGYLASVRFSGMIREDDNPEATSFEEVWNLHKPDGKGWLLAGIQQLQSH